MDDAMLGRPVSIKGRTSRSPLLPVSSPALCVGFIHGHFLSQHSPYARRTLYPRSPTFPSSQVGGGSQNRRSMKTRSQLFEDVIVQLDSAAGEAREDGAEELATYIEETLIPFIEEERLEAMAEEIA
jgi:hypothetical protein